MEETEKITAVKKEKYPKRVEAGKRLAKISKESKEKKMRERIKREEGYALCKDYRFIFGAIGAVAAIVAIYYACKSNKKEVKVLNEIREELEDTPKLEKGKPKSCIDSLRRK